MTLGLDLDCQNRDPERDPDPVSGMQNMYIGRRAQICIRECLSSGRAAGAADCEKQVVARVGGEGVYFGSEW